MKVIYVEDGTNTVLSHEYFMPPPGESEIELNGKTYEVVRFRHGDDFPTSMGGFVCVFVREVKE